MESEVRPVVPGWEAQPSPQAAFVASTLFEVVYGGARGGGKTDAALGEFATHAAAHGKAAKGLLVRRTRVALLPTIDRAREIYRGMAATWQEQKSRFVWPNGAVLYVRYLDRDQDADAYQGHDYTRVYVEEITQFASPRPIDKLKATLRSAAGVPCGFQATCNPSGPGHAWVKAAQGKIVDPTLDPDEYGAWFSALRPFEQDAARAAAANDILGAVNAGRSDMFGSPLVQRRMETAFGPDAAADLVGKLRLETIASSLRLPGAAGSSDPQAGASILAPRNSSDLDTMPRYGAGPNAFVPSAPPAATFFPPANAAWRVQQDQDRQ